MAKGDNAGSDVFDVARIRDLIDLMEERGLCELDLKHADQQVRLVRGSTTPIAAAPAPVAAAAPVAPTAAPAADSEHIVTITAPMVGSYYSKPNPKSADFVRVGDSINAETVICIIEAMKVFNEIPAEMSGKVTEILVSNEQAVDFGCPLFKVDTRG